MMMDVFNDMDFAFSLSCSAGLPWLMCMIDRSIIGRSAKAGC